MDSFSELMKLVEENQTTLKNFLDREISLTFEQSVTEMNQSKEHYQKVQDRLNQITRRQEGIGNSNDLCAFYMNEWLSVLYEYSTLLAYTKRLSVEYLKLKTNRPRKHQNKYAKDFG